MTSSSATPTPAVPSTAERVRSACVRAAALLVVDGPGPTPEPVSVPLCHLLGDGTLALAVPFSAPVATAAATRDGRTAMVELSDQAPVALREPIRALVWLRGALTAVPGDDVDVLTDRIAAAEPNPALLQVHSLRSAGARRHDDPERYRLFRLAIESVVLADATGAELVDLNELAAAEADPFCAIEADWLYHLDTTHPEIAERLATRLPAALRRGIPRPLGIDRYGIWLRIEAPTGDHDARLPFHRPVADVTELNRAVRVLMGCPFRNGLMPRQR